MRKMRGELPRCGKCSQESCRGWPRSCGRRLGKERGTPSHTAVAPPFLGLHPPPRPFPNRLQAELESTKGTLLASEAAASELRQQLAHAREAAAERERAHTALVQHLQRDMNGDYFMCKLSNGLLLTMFQFMEVMATQLPARFATCSIHCLLDAMLGFGDDVLLLVVVVVLFHDYRPAMFWHWHLQTKPCIDVLMQCLGKKPSRAR